MNLEWIKNIDEKTISYLESLKSSSEDPEYFPVLENITEQGEKIKLGFSCFALKIIFILNQIENYDLKNWTSYLNSYQNNIKGFPDNSFIDNNYLGYDLYYYNIDGKNIVYNSNKKILGYLRDWIDEDEEVPREYKTIDNKVLHPFTKLPIIEIEITKSGSGFEPIKEGLYRECEYNDQLETLTSTNQIIRNS